MIEVKDITKTYGSGDTAFQALKGVSFTINDGEFVAIMGPSGSGKSTMMHILGCLDTPTRGEYFLDGKDVSKLTDEELAEIRKDKDRFRLPVVQSSARARRCCATSCCRSFMRVSAKRSAKRRARSALLSAGMGETQFMHKSQRAFRRPNPARRDCPRARERPDAHSCRRADRQPRHARPAKSCSARSKNSTTSTAARSCSSPTSPTSPSTPSASS